VPTAAERARLRRESGMAMCALQRVTLQQVHGVPSLRTVLSFAATVSTSQQRCRGVAPPSLSSQEAWLLGERCPEGGGRSATFPESVGLCVGTWYTCFQ